MNLQQRLATAIFAMTSLAVGLVPASADVNTGPDLVVTVAGAQTHVVTFPDTFTELRSAPVTIRFTSVGDVLPVVVRGLETAGAVAAFPVLRDSCLPDTVLKSGESCELEIAFEAATVGEHSATFDLIHDADARTSVTAHATTLASSPGFELDRTSVAFDPLALGYGTGAFVVASNTGIGNLHINEITMLGPDAESFYVDAANRCRSQIVEQGQTCRIGISFVPRRAGTIAGTIRITHDAPGSPTYVDVRAEGFQIFPELLPGSIVFGSIDSGGERTVVATLNSNYYAKMTVHALRIEGTDAGDFTVSNDTCVGRTFSPNQTCTITMLFHPIASGIKSARLAVVSDAPGNVRTFPLSGIALVGAGEKRDGAAEGRLPVILPERDDPCRECGGRVGIQPTPSATPAERRTSRG